MSHFWLRYLSHFWRRCFLSDPPDLNEWWPSSACLNGNKPGLPQPFESSPFRPLADAVLFAYAVTQRHMVSPTGTVKQVERDPVRGAVCPHLREANLPHFWNFHEFAAHASSFRYSLAAPTKPHTRFHISTPRGSAYRL